MKRTDRQVFRNAVAVIGALAIAGIVPAYGRLRVGRSSLGYWLAYLEPAVVPGDEWKQ